MTNKHQHLKATELALLAFEYENQLRDRFACAALTALIRPMFGPNGYTGVNSEAFQLCTEAYKFADAMIECRRYD